MALGCNATTLFPLLPDLAGKWHKGDALCVPHTFTFKQISDDLDAGFVQVLAGLSRGRRVFSLGYEWRNDHRSPTPSS